MRAAVSERSDIDAMRKDRAVKLLARWGMLLFSLGVWAATLVWLLA